MREDNVSREAMIDFCEESGINWNHETNDAVLMLRICDYLQEHDLFDFDCVLCGRTYSKELVWCPYCGRDTNLDFPAAFRALSSSDCNLIRIYDCLNKRLWGSIKYTTLERLENEGILERLKVEIEYGLGITYLCYDTDIANIMSHSK
jgi:hypothetical protein